MQVTLADTLGIGDADKSNPGSTAVYCMFSSVGTSSGSDSFQWICYPRIAANQVKILRAGATADLAEVVIVGFEWGK